MCYMKSRSPKQALLSLEIYDDEEEELEIPEDINDLFLANKGGAYTNIFRRVSVAILKKQSVDLNDHEKLMLTRK